MKKIILEHAKVKNSVLKLQMMKSKRKLVPSDEIQWNRMKKLK